MDMNAIDLLIWRLNENGSFDELVALMTMMEKYLPEVYARLDEKALPQS